MAIKIKGIIGWDVIGSEFADRLSRLDGDITFEIDSPGGSVFHGISIFNAIKNYNKGKCTMHVVGDCSSMAAYIMLAGDGDVQFEPNSIVVLHNPWSCTQGDYKAMYKEGKVLEQMAKMYASEFVKRGLFEEKEIRQIMDEETWFIGANDLKKLGVVLGDSDKASDDDNEPDETQTPEIKIAALKERMSEAKDKIKALKDDNVEKIAALISDRFKSSVATSPIGSTNKIENVEQKQDKKGEKKMDLKELMANEPKVYGEAKQDGINAEKKRVAALMAFIDIDRKAVMEAIENGSSVNDETFTSKILMEKINKNEIQGMQDESPKDLQPKAEVHEPEQNVNSDQPKEPTEEEKAKAEEEALAKITARMHF